MIPIPLAMLQLLGFGLGLLLGTLNVFFRDIAEWVDVTLKLVFWTVPIVYRLNLEQHWLAVLVRWHPLMPALDSIRGLFLDHQLPNGYYWVGMITWPLAICTFAFAVLGKLRPEIRDVI